MAYLDINSLGPVLKQKFTKKKFNTLGYKHNTAFGLVKKETDWDGDVYRIPLAFANPQGRAHDLQRADANITPTGYRQFALTRARDFSLFGITTEAIRAAKGEPGSVIKSLSSEIEKATMSLTRNMAQELYRNGGTARANGSSVSNAVLTLTQPADCAQFEYGMTCVSSATDGTSGSVRAGSVQIVGIDRDAGTLTANVNWATGITGFAATDYIFQDGDFGAGMKGFLAWLPTTAPSQGENFFGTDRSVDATRLGGVRISGGGGPIEETLIEAAARLGREGSSADVCLMNPLDMANFIKAISGKNIYERGTRQSVDEPSVGYKSIRVMWSTGDIDIMQDVNCPKGKAFMLQMDTWVFASLGEAPGIIDEDGLTFVRNVNSDDYKGRVGYYGQLGCSAPGWNAVITL